MMRVKQIRVKKKMRDSGKILELSEEERKLFDPMFKMVTGKPVDFLVLLPSDVEEYVFECVETELDGVKK
jgi:hypothetical protein